MRSVRAWLLAAILLGAAQQIFVVLRNPFLDALRFRGDVIGIVQASGGAAGILAGLIGLRAFGTIRWRAAFAAGAAANALGFGIQALASSPLVFALGAAIAGLGIQGLAMTAAPFLSEHAPDEHRERYFAMHALFIQGLPGAVGAVLGGEVESAAGRSAGSLVGFRIALGVATCAALVAIAPVLAIRGRTKALGAIDAAELRALLPLLLPDALLYFALGLSVPYLQLYFIARFHLPPPSVGRIFAAAMIVGALSQLLAPSVAKRWSARAVVLGSAALLLPVLFLLAVTRSLVVAVGAFIGRQALSMAASPMLASFLHRSVPAERSARLAASRMIVLSIAWAGANAVGGLLLDADPDFSVLLGATVALQGAGLIAAWISYRGR